VGLAELKADLGGTVLVSSSPLFMQVESCGRVGYPCLQSFASFVARTDSTGLIRVE
jgi:hypothetical protein